MAEIKEGGLEVRPDYEGADAYIARKPRWTRSDQTRDDAAVLIALARQAQPTLMLEIGASAGEGAGALLWGAPKAELWGIDLRDNVWYEPKKPIGAVVDEGFPEAVPRYHRLPKRHAGAVSEIVGEFQLVHIDANHSHPWALYDFLRILPALTKGALVAFHDASYLAPRSQAAYYLCRLLPRPKVFVGNHCVFRYEGMTDALFAALLDCAEVSWQSNLAPECFDGLYESLSPLMSGYQRAKMLSVMLDRNANYYRLQSVYDPVFKAHWSREVNHRKQVEELKARATFVQS